MLPCCVPTPSWSRAARSSTLCPTADPGTRSFQSIHSPPNKTPQTARWTNDVACAWSRLCYHRTTVAQGRSVQASSDGTMQHIEPISEDEMVAVFLRTEIASMRFAQDIQ